MRKKIFTLLTLLATVCSGAWAGETTTLYERGTTNVWVDTDASTAWTGTGTAAIDGGLKTSGGNESYERALTISPTSNAIVTLTATWNTGSSTGRAGGYNYLILGGVEFRAYGQDAKGTVVIGDNETQITSAKTDVRGDAEWTITATINTATGAVTTTVTLPSGEVTPAPSGTTSTAISSIAMGYHKPGRITSTYQTLTKVEITEETQEVTTADYTINYIYNETTIKTTNGNTAVDNVVNAENPITVEDVKYYIKDDETTSMTIVEGTNVLNVNMRVANTYSYTVRALDGSSNVLNASLATGSATEGDAVTVSFPRYILSGTTLYCQNTGAVEYSTTFTPDADAYVQDVTYSNSTVSNVAFYIDAEDVEGVTVGSNVRASKGQMGYTADADTYVDVTTIPAGKYVIFMRAQNGNNAERAYNIKVGDNVVMTGSFAQGTNLDFTSEVFTVSTESTLSFASEGSGASGIDYIYLVELPTVSVTISEAGYATYINSDCALDFSEVEGLTAYTAAVEDNNVTFTQVTKVPANTGVLLKGAAATYEIPATYYTGAETSALVGGETAPAGTYVLMASPEVGFYCVLSDFTLGANTCYLNAGVESRPFIALDGVATGIAAMQNVQNNSNVVYNLNGQRVMNAQKGLYIINGKKVVKK